VPGQPNAAAYESWAWRALEHFDVEALGVSFLGHNSGVAYRVRAPRQDYLLKVHVPHGSSEVLAPAQVEGAMQWLADLSELGPGFPVQTPVRDRSGRLLPGIALEGRAGATPCSLQAWVEGEVTAGDLTEERAKAVGRMTARLHGCAARWEPAPGLTETVLDATWFAARQQALLDRLGDGLVDDAVRAASAAAGSTVERLLREVPVDRQVFGPVHGDLHQENVVWVGEDPRPIDFAYLRLAPYAWDLGVLCYHTMYLPVGVRRSLVAAYRNERPGLPEQPPLEAFVVAAAVDNLAFQLSIAEQRGSALLRANLADFARDYCVALSRGHEFVL